MSELNDDCWLCIIKVLQTDYRTLSRLLRVNRRLFELTVPVLYGDLFDPEMPNHQSNWSSQKRQRLGLLLLFGAGILDETAKVCLGVAEKLIKKDVQAMTDELWVPGRTDDDGNDGNEENEGKRKIFVAAISGTQTTVSGKPSSSSSSSSSSIKPVVVGPISGADASSRIRNALFATAPTTTTSLTSRWKITDNTILCKDFPMSASQTRPKTTTVNYFKLLKRINQRVWQAFNWSTPGRKELSFELVYPHLVQSLVVPYESIQDMLSVVDQFAQLAHLDIWESGLANESYPLDSLPSNTTTTTTPADLSAAAAAATLSLSSSSITTTAHSSTSSLSNDQIQKIIEFITLHRNFFPGVLKQIRTPIDCLFTINEVLEPSQLNLSEGNELISRMEKPKSGKVFRNLITLTSRQIDHCGIMVDGKPLLQHCRKLKELYLMSDSEYHEPSGVFEWSVQEQRELELATGTTTVGGGGGSLSSSLDLERRIPPVKIIKLAYVHPQDIEQALDGFRATIEQLEVNQMDNNRIDTRRLQWNWPLNHLVKLTLRTSGLDYSSIQYCSKLEILSIVQPFFDERRALPMTTTRWKVPITVQVLQLHGESFVYMDHSSLKDVIGLRDICFKCFEDYDRLTTISTRGQTMMSQLEQISTWDFSTGWRFEKLEQLKLYGLAFKYWQGILFELAPNLRYLDLRPSLGNSNLQDSICEALISGKFGHHLEAMRLTFPKLGSKWMELLMNQLTGSGSGSGIDGGGGTSQDKIQDLQQPLPFSKLRALSIYHAGDRDTFLVKYLDKIPIMMSSPRLRNLEQIQLGCDGHEVILEQEWSVLMDSNQLRCPKFPESLDSWSTNLSLPDFCVLTTLFYNKSFRLRDGWKPPVVAQSSSLKSESRGSHSTTGTKSIGFGGLSRLFRK